MVHGHYDEEEDNGGDDHEREHLVEEVAVAKRAAVDREVQRREIGLTTDRGEQRRDEVGDESVDDGLKAAPTTTATARSTTLPRRRNALKSLSMLMRCPPRFESTSSQEASRAAPIREIKFAPLSCQCGIGCRRQEHARCCARPENVELWPWRHVPRTISPPPRRRGSDPATSPAAEEDRDERDFASVTSLHVDLKWFPQPYPPNVS